MTNEKLIKHHKSPSVVIVLSTFNGENHLRDQLDSLLHQTYKNFRILVRDDGSHDETRIILASYSKTNTNMDVLLGENIGVVGSFLQLIENVPPTTEFISLCDQDDVWDKDKIERAISFMTRVNPEIPAMYCGAVDIVDDTLTHIRSGRLPKRKPTMRNALVENIATGCTIVINNEARKLISNNSACIGNIAMHDWWLYLVVSTFGHVIFDDKPKIQYRQHANNVIGTYFGVRFWVNRIKRQFGTSKNVIYNQSKELMRVYGSKMSNDKQALLQTFLLQASAKNIYTRSLYAVRKSVYRQRVIDDILLRIAIVLGRI